MTSSAERCLEHECARSFPERRHRLHPMSGYTPASYSQVTRSQLRALSTVKSQRDAFSTRTHSAIRSHSASVRIHLVHDLRRARVVPLRAAGLHAALLPLFARPPPLAIQPRSAHDLSLARNACGLRTPAHHRSLPLLPGQTDETYSFGRRMPRRRAVRNLTAHGASRFSLPPLQGGLRALRQSTRTVPCELRVTE